MSTKRLFVVCPFSQIEGFLRYKYGQESMFATAMAGNPQVEDALWLNSLVDTIRREGVTELFLVQDLQCRFLQVVMSGDAGFGTLCEVQLHQIVENNREKISAESSWANQLFAFASLKIVNQTNQIASLPLMVQLIQETGLSVQGIVSDKSTDALWLVAQQNQGAVLTRQTFSVVA